MQTKFERFLSNETYVISNLKKREKEFINQAADKEYAKNEFFKTMDKEFRILQTKISFNADFFHDIEKKKRLNKNYDEAQEYKGLSEVDIKGYSTITAYKKYHSTYLSKLNRDASESPYIIKWNEKKGNKIVYANFLKKSLPQKLGAPI